MAGTWAAARENRAFLRRAVDVVSRAGCDQFLDLGSGIPTVGNVHEVAWRVDPRARVVYVDQEPVACETARQMLVGMETVGVVEADLRDSTAVLDAPETRTLLDFSRPVAVLALSCLHFVPGDAAAMVAPYRQALAPASHLVVSHVATPLDLPGNRADAATAVSVYNRSPSPLTVRGLDQIRAIFGGMELLDPGLVPLMDWRPDGPVDEALRARFSFFGGVARQPGRP